MGPKLGLRVVELSMTVRPFQVQLDASSIYIGGLPSGISPTLLFEA